MQLPRTQPDNLNELLEICIDLLRTKLPSGWALYENRNTKEGPDACIAIRTSDGTEIALAAEVKMSIERRDVGAILDQVASYTRNVGAVPLVVSRYLSPTVRTALTERSASYVDATGNIRLQIPSPLIFISDRGLDSDPWRNRLGRPRGTLKGSPASRVIRSLVDTNRDWTARELVDDARASTGATYRVLEYLQNEDLITRDESARYRVRSWRALIEAWSRDYSFQKANRAMSYLDPRGIANLIDNAQPTQSFEWAFTGSIASAEWSEYAPARAAMVYVENISIAAELWGLRAADSGANVILAEPESDVVFRRTMTSARTGLRIAAPSQVAVDLLTGPGRNPSEGVELLNWMERNERLWRA